MAEPAKNRLIVTQDVLEAEVAGLVDSAPETLDTLAELAAALGDDPNFATTTAEAIGKRAKIDGAPAAYDSLGKLVSALIAGELGGSTDGIAVGDIPPGAEPPPATAGVLGVAVGSGAQAGWAATAIGNEASADGDESAAIGVQASAAGDGSTAIGIQASADGGASTAIGLGASAAGEGSAAIGAMSSAPDPWTIAIGAAPSSGATHHVTIPGTLDVAGKAVSTVDHTHPVSDLSASGTASSSTYLRGDGSWQTPPNTNTTYAVPSQAEAEAGTATTARAFSAQRAHQAAIAASGKKDWQGTQAQYDALGTKEADRTYWIV